MPDVVTPTQTNTDAGPANADVKPTNTVLGSNSNATPQVTPEVKAEAKVADPTKEKEANPPEEKKDEKAKTQGAPEKYEFKFPETVKLDEEALTEATNTFKELNLPQEQAQKVMDVGVKHIEKVLTQAKEAQEKALNDAGEAWFKEIQTDKEYGGANFKKSNEAALRFRDKFTTPEERKQLAALFDSGWGNHPVLWKMLVRGGLAMGEDQVVDGAASAAEPSAAKVLYPEHA